MLNEMEGAIQGGTTSIGNADIDDLLIWQCDTDIPIPRRLEGSDMQSSRMFVEVGATGGFAELGLLAASSYTLNDLQSMALQLVCRFLDKYVANTDAAGQHLQYIGGPGGTGKPRIIDALRDVFTTVFQNNKTRYAAKQFAQVPIIAGANLHEETDTGMWLSAQGIKDRAAASSQPIFFYHYNGAFSNISPIPSAGAYHSSKLPLIMGTFNDINGLGPGFETETSRTLQDLWLAFATDPTQGLVASGWEPYPSAVILGDTTKQQVFQSVQVSEAPGWNECLPVDA